jgi:hypothetical protein
VRALVPGRFERSTYRSMMNPLSRLGLGRLAALPAAAIVHFLVFLSTTLVPWLVQALTPWPLVALAVGIAVAVVMCGWSTRLLRRFAARLVPLRASGKRRPIAAFVCAGLALTSYGAILLWVRLLLEPSPHYSGPGSFEFYTVVPGCAWAIAFGPLALDYYRGRPRKDAYVLYLRTFLSFSDRAMMALLFSVIGGRRRVVVLTAPRSDAASWDPILIAFRGNPLLRPRAKVPVFMTATDADWQASVERLIEGATHTIVDVSTLTPGVQTELEILRDTTRSVNVLWLCEASRAEVLEKVRQLVGSSMVPADRVLFYTKSIVAALPGIAAGLGISLLCLSLLPLISNLQQGRTPLRGDNTAETVGRLIGAVFPAALFFLAVFLRPAVDRQARRRLRTLLADVRV